MTPTATRPLPGTTRDPLYPDSDGRPMGETDFHSFALVLLRQALQDCFAAVLDVYVATNLLFYYERGNPSGRRDPDVLVARGVGRHLRRSYRLWEEGVLPCTFFEISSEGTWGEDLGAKRALYARLKIPEYFLFDPEARYLDPPLQGFRLVNGVSVPMVPAADGSLVSTELGLRLLAEGPMLRLFDLKTGEPVLTRAEVAEHEKQRAEEEKQRAEQAKQQAEHEKHRAEEEKQRAEQAKQQAEHEKHRAEEEKQRAEQAKQQAEHEKHRAEEEKQRAEQEHQRAEQAKQQAAQEQQRAEYQQQRAAVLVAEVERLRALLDQQDAAQE